MAVSESGMQGSRQVSRQSGRHASRQVVRQAGKTHPLRKQAFSNAEFQEGN